MTNKILLFSTNTKTMPIFLHKEPPINANLVMNNLDAVENVKSTILRSAPAHNYLTTTTTSAKKRLHELLILTLCGVNVEFLVSICITQMSPIVLHFVPA